MNVKRHLRSAADKEDQGAKVFSPICSVSVTIKLLWSCEQWPDLCPQPEPKHVDLLLRPPLTYRPSRHAACLQSKCQIVRQTFLKGRKHIPFSTSTPWSCDRLSSRCCKSERWWTACLQLWKPRMPQYWYWLCISVWYYAASQYRIVIDFIWKPDLVFSTKIYTTVAEYYCQLE